MLGLGEALALPDVATIAPEAAGRSWWPVSFLAPMAELAPWLHGALEIVGGAVSTLEAQGLSRRAITVCGFSQGACLALEFAARHGASLSAAFGFSGALLGTSDAPGPTDDDHYGYGPKRFDYTHPLDGLIVDMSCHERDPHIPLARFRDSARVLETQGAAVTSRTYPGPGHSLTEDDIAALRRHLDEPASDGTHPVASR